LQWGLERINQSDLNFSRATARFWLKMLSTVIFAIGLFIALFTEKSQALHDIIARTLVQRKLKD
jgi:eukaryotic-like serine/threonine-protein kinase